MVLISRRGLAYKVRQFQLLAVIIDAIRLVLLLEQNPVLSTRLCAESALVPVVYVLDDNFLHVLQREDCVCHAALIINSVLPDGTLDYVWEIEDNGERLEIT